MNFTFNEIKEKLITKLKEFSDWKTQILTVGVYSVLLDVMSFIIEKFAFYVDYLFLETTTRATLISSVIKQAAFRGYIALRRSGATGILTIGTDESFTTRSLIYTGNEIQINKWTQFSNENGDAFCYAIENGRFPTNSNQRNRNPDIGSSAFNVGNGIIGIPIIGHPFVAGEKIYITGTINYDGIFIANETTIPDRLHIEATYVTETFSGTEKISAGYLFLNVREGIPEEFVYIAQGTLNEQIPIYVANIEQNEIEVFLIDSNDVIVTQVTIVNDLFFVDDTTIYTCEIQNFDDYTGIFVKFGDDITSRKLATNERILIKFARTDGADSDIGSAAIITQSINPLTDIFNAEVSDIFIRNEKPIVGGSNLQPLIEIKKQSQRFAMSGYQLNNRASWTAAVEEKEFINRGLVWTELDISKGTLSLVAQTLQNVHYITAITNKGEALTPSEESEISTDILIPRKSPTDIISWQKLEKLKIRFIINGFIQNTISFVDMTESLRTTLTNNFSALNLEFSEEIYESNFTKIIDSTSKMIRHETTAFYVEENISIQNILHEILVSKPSSVDSDPEEQIYIANNSPEIWIRRRINSIWYSPVQVAYTSGISILGQDGYNISGTVVYISNKISYQMFDILLDTVPSISKTVTTMSNSNIISINNTSGLKIGMYLAGLNIQENTQIANIITNTSITMTNPTTTSPGSTGTVLFGLHPDFGESFGTQNPNEDDIKGYILYLMYQTIDGNGNRLNDLRLAKFNQILDFSHELSTYNLQYEIPKNNLLT